MVAPPAYLKPAILNSLNAGDSGELSLCQLDLNCEIGCSSNTELAETQ